MIRSGKSDWRSREAFPKKEGAGVYTCERVEGATLGPSSRLKKNPPSFRGGRGVEAQSVVMGRQRVPFPPGMSAFPSTGF